MAAPALLLCLNLAVFGTYAVYMGNTGEFLVPYLEALELLLFPALGLTVILILFALALNTRQAQAFCAMLFFLGVVSYAHGNLLRWDTGVLDGSALDFSRDSRSFVDAALWLILGWLSWRYRRFLAVQGWKICVVLVVFQLIGAYKIAKNLKDTTSVSQGIPEKYLDLSSNNNVIHIILDAFQANVFEHVLASDPKIQSDLRGFTFFRNAITPSEVTFLSVPAALSGRIYRNEIPISQFHEQTLGGRNLYRFLSVNDYAINIATPNWWNLKRDYYSSYYRIPAPYADQQELHTTALLLLDISLFRQSPHFLKPLIYQSGAWLFSHQLARYPEQQFKHFAHSEFLRDFTQRVRVGGGQPAYIFMHLLTPHAPLVSDRNCGFTGEELKPAMESFGDQSRCILKLVTALLKRLEQLGVYDDSLVIIHGDHGGPVPFDMRDIDGRASDSLKALDKIWGNPLPLVLVKPLHATGPFHISQAPVSLADIPATVTNLLEMGERFPGRSMYAVEEKDRPREFYRSTVRRNEAMVKDRFEDFSRFTVSGNIYDLAAWSEEVLLPPPGGGEAGQYDWGSEIIFGDKGNSKPFQKGGWAVTRSSDSTWTEGYAAHLDFNFPAANGPVRMVARLKPFLVAGKLERQRVTVVINDHELIKWILTEDEFQDLELVIPEGLLNVDRATRISFITPDANSPRALKSGRGEIEYALSFSNLRFIELKSR